MRRCAVTDMKSGFIATYTVLIVLTVVAAATVAVTLLSIGSAQGSLALGQGRTTLALVEGCTEDAVLKSWANVGFTSTTITRPEGSCQVTVSKVGQVWTETITNTTSTTYVRTIQVVFTRASTGLSLTSWLEQ